jgi:hypothetical protein
MMSLYTDEELTALALSADPDQSPAPDAEPFQGSDGAAAELLPAWYMPAPRLRSRKRWHTSVVLLIIAAFALINALGFCITYGHLVIA